MYDGFAVHENKICARASTLTTVGQHYHIPIPHEGQLASLLTGVVTQPLALLAFSKMIKTTDVVFVQEVHVRFKGL